MTSDHHDPSVATSDGTVRGERLGHGGAVFRGIPYAAPPTGEGRFAPPRPVEPWDGVRDATHFGPAAVQPRGGPASRSGLFGPGDLPVSEDCLTLNVWTPGLDDERRPVMVWIHGGAFRLGTSGSPTYDGRRLAERGDVVVVSLNYRLGLLGFLASPELGAANNGLRDQIAALRWVQREIARFGGDPERVTVFGESAGAKSIECLLAMPSAAGLFHRAILQSTYATSLDPRPARARARAIAAHLGIADDMEQLRHVELRALLAAEAAVLAEEGPDAEGRGGGGPVLDGSTLPAAPLDAVTAGAAADIPLVIGTTLDEWRLFAAMGSPDGGSAPDHEGLGARFAALLGGVDPSGPEVVELLACYRAERARRGQPATPADLAVDAMTDRLFRQHSVRLAEAASAHGETYMYLFTWPSPIDDGRLGACHGVELGFVFSTLDTVAAFSGDTDDARALSDIVSSAWTRFAHGHPPATARRRDWPPYEPTRRSTMLLGAECRPVDAPLDEVRRLWTSAPL